MTDRPEHIRGRTPALNSRQVRAIRQRLDKRRRALAIARRHSDKLIARDLGVSPKVVRNVDSPEAYQWVRP